MGDAIDMTFPASFRYARSQSIADEFDVNSPNCFNARGPTGRQVSKLVTLTAAGDPVAVNLFVVSGFVEIYRIFGVFEDVTNVDDIEGVYLDQYDGTVNPELTLSDNVVCDGAALGSVMIKVDAATAVIEFLNANQCRVYESSKNDINTPTALNAKNGVTTYIRMLYKNVDTALNCQIRWYAEWRSLCGSPGEVTAA